MAHAFGPGGEAGELAQLVTQETGTGQHTREGFLYQILGILPGAAERPCGPVQVASMP